MGVAGLVGERSMMQQSVWQQDGIVVRLYVVPALMLQTHCATLSWDCSA
jgi:hypothetical protein